MEPKQRKAKYNLHQAAFSLFSSFILLFSNKPFNDLSRAVTVISSSQQGTRHVTATITSDVHKAFFSLKSDYDKQGTKMPNILQRYENTNYQTIMSNVPKVVFYFRSKYDNHQTIMSNVPKVDFYFRSKYDNYQTIMSNVPKVDFYFRSKYDNYQTIMSNVPKVIFYFRSKYDNYNKQINGMKILNHKENQTIEKLKITEYTTQRQTNFI